MMRRRSLNIIVLLTISAIFIIFMQACFPSNQKYQTYTTRIAKKHILLWTKHFYDFNLKDLLDNRDLLSFDKFHCPVHQCSLTGDRNFFERLSEFDAILFYERNVYFYDKDLPDVRDPRQLYILGNIESPMNTEILEKYGKFRHYFNVSMNYRRDADIKINTFGRVFRVRDHPPPGPELDKIIKRFGQENKHKAFKENKKSSGAFVAQFISNCEAFSGRELITKSLKQFLKVDVYGKCGDLTCHDDLNNGDPDNLCYGLLESSYKFYLAFENSLCKDYLTEKFYNALAHSVVPVVLSGADMSLRAPPHSFINVEDFNSTSELAAFLTRLAADEERLASYFWWRDYYQVVVGREVENQHWCDMCALLHQEKPFKQKTVDLRKIYDENDNCRTLKTFIDLSVNVNGTDLSESLTYSPFYTSEEEGRLDSVSH